MNGPAQLPAAQTEHFKGMLESAHRLLSKQHYPPPPRAQPKTFVLKDDGEHPRTVEYAYHALNAAQRARIGPDGQGSVRVPIIRGLPHVIYREMRGAIRRAVRKEGATFDPAQAEAMAAEVAGG